ncbi:hypothetical protein HpKG65_06280 [Helicobacter pylori]
MSGVHIVENMNTENTNISRTTASTPPNNEELLKLVRDLADRLKKLEDLKLEDFEPLRKISHLIGSFFLLGKSSNDTQENPKDAQGREEALKKVQEVQEENAKLNRDKNNLAREKDKLADQNKTLIETNQELTTEKERLERENKNLATGKESLTKEKTELTDKNKELDNQVGLLKGQVQALEQSQQALQNEKTDLTEENKRLTTEKTELNNKITGLQTETKIL